MIKNYNFLIRHKILENPGILVQYKNKNHLKIKIIEGFNYIIKVKKKNQSFLTLLIKIKFCPKLT